jgi:porin
MRIGKGVGAVCGLLLSLAVAWPAPAQSGDDPDKAREGPPKPDWLGSIGTLGGTREWLEGQGITLSLIYTAEGFANLRGGVRRGAIYEGNFESQVDVDLEKLVGIPGLAFRAQAYQIHGRGMSRHKTLNFMTVSNIEALHATRLAELWLEQTLFDGTLAVRAGQIAGDTEFLASDVASLFVNGTFGWPQITGADLSGGGPAYPLPTPGVRVKVQPTKDVVILAAIFNGDPSGGGTGDPQRINRHGTRFPVSDPPLLIGEVAYAHSRGDGTLPGTVKLGGWYHTGRFADQRYDSTGLSLADPASSGVARQRRSDGGLYAVADQMLWQVPGNKDGGLAAFTRLAVSPGDRNQFSFYADGGFTLKGVLNDRPNDGLGVAFAYARVSKRARALDRDSVAFGIPTPIRSSEAVVEVTYQAQIVDGWTIQPDFQYILRPGGHVSNPREPGRAIKNAVVVGLRTTIQY